MRARALPGQFDIGIRSNPPSEEPLSPRSRRGPFDSALRSTVRLGERSDFEPPPRASNSSGSSDTSPSLLDDGPGLGRCHDEPPLFRQFQRQNPALPEGQPTVRSPRRRVAGGWRLLGYFERWHSHWQPETTPWFDITNVPELRPVGYPFLDLKNTESSIIRRFLFDPRSHRSQFNSRTLC